MTVGTGRTVLAAIEQEYARYRAMAEGVLDQIDDDRLCTKPSAESNSIATLVWHVSGNLESRFTNFLDEDGEKPWRDREGELSTRTCTLAEARARWAEGWQVLESALAELDDADLGRTITIRGVEHSVAEALARSLGHTAGHVAQIAYAGKLLVGGKWRYLSIPPGGTAAYNADPTLEKGPARQ